MRTIQSCLAIAAMLSVIVLLGCSPGEPDAQPASTPGKSPTPGGPGAAAGPAAKPEITEGDVYALDVCPVSGEKLGEMGDPVIIKHEGREVRFCCKNCAPKFEEDPAKYLAKMDELMANKQSKHYPLDTCIVSGTELAKNSKDVIVNNRLVRFCSDECDTAFAADAAGYFAKLDAAVIASQKDAYPFDKCVVMGETFGTHREPAEIVVANQLVRFCCPGCGGDFNENPAKYLDMIDSGKLEATGHEGSTHK